jgi:predicted Ser/Thr protein kinase
MAETFFELNYIVGHKIGSGSFGEVFWGKDNNSNEEVAIKLELIDSRNPQLLYESKILRIFKGSTGFPGIRWYGSNKTHNILVMDLLGASVEECYVQCGRRLNLKTVLMLTD